MSDERSAMPADLRADLLVAGVSAAGAVLLTVASAASVTGTIPPLPRLAPIGVYLVYLLLGRGSTGSRFEDPRVWAAFAVLTAAGVLAAHA